MSEAGEKRKDEESVQIGEPDAKKPKVEDAAAAPEEGKPEEKETVTKKTKKSKKKDLLRAKYDALEAESNESEPKKEDSGSADSEKPADGASETPETGNPVNNEEDEDEYQDDEDDDDEDNGGFDDDEDDEDDEDDDDEELGEDVEEDLDELSEPEIEPGSRRRRQPVDYAKVLAEMEAEERAMKEGKTAAK